MPLKTYINTMPDRLRPLPTTIMLPICTNQDKNNKLTTGRANKRATLINRNHKLHLSIISTGTWNIRTLRRCGKLEEPTNELKRYRWDIIGMAKIMMTGSI